MDFWTTVQAVIVGNVATTVLGFLAGFFYTIGLGLWALTKNRRKW
jgi:hypothetical protein